MSDKGTRKACLRKIDRCSGLLENCIQHLGSIYQIYNPTHPEIGLKIVLLIEAYRELQNANEKLKKGF